MRTIEAVKLTIGQQYARCCNGCNNFEMQWMQVLWLFPVYSYFIFLFFYF